MGSWRVHHPQVYSLGYNPYVIEDRKMLDQRRLKKKEFKKASWPDRLSKIVAAQDFKCPVCNQIMHPSDNVQVHHVVSQKQLQSISVGSKIIAISEELVVVHTECHQTLT